MPASNRKPSTPPGFDPLVRLLGAWRLWLLGALLGALLGWAVYALFPPDFRARATVVVDQNLEEAWQYFPDRQLFQFMERETERLEELAWSDEVIAGVAAQVPGVSVAELRAGRLQLAQPGDGVWRFYADAGDAGDAQALASAWAGAFVDAARRAVEASPELDAARRALDTELALGDDADPERIEQLTTQITDLADDTRGISPYTELSLSQAVELPIERSRSLGAYLLVASLLGALVAALYVLLYAGKLLA